jgi:DNA-3-methyladenine glycosylase
VLVRAIEATFGEDWMRAQRPVHDRHQLSSGPGKLCSALDIDRSLDGADICDAKSPLFVARNPEQKQFLLQQSPMVTTTRIGISRAAELPLRFYLAGSPFLSRKHPQRTPEPGR